MPRSTKPKAARPAVLQRCLEFNRVVGVDLLEAEVSGAKYTFLNLVC
jgi:hypothetical protein